MNQDWKIQNFKIEGLKAITPFCREDNRGYFLKTYESKRLEQANAKQEVGELFETFSGQGVIRGLHFQTKNPQAKLVRVVFGEIFDVAVDLRKDSPTFGQHQIMHLDGTNHFGFYLPAGFAHGFQVLSSNALVSYVCFGEFLQKYDTGIFYADEELGISWPVAQKIVSEKDRNLMSFKSFREKYGALEAERQ